MFKLSKDEIADALNEWMRRFVDEPDRFKHEWQTVAEFIEQDVDGTRPEYGVGGAEYLLQIIEEMRNA